MRLILFSVFILLNGCATAPSNAPKYWDIKIKEPTEDTAILVLYRTMTAPTLYNMPVLVNGQKVIEIPNEAFTWLEIPAGNNTVTIDWPLWVGISNKSLKANFEPNKTHYIKLGGDLFIEENLLECCRYIPIE